MIVMIKYILVALLNMNPNIIKSKDRMTYIKKTNIILNCLLFTFIHNYIKLWKKKLLTMKYLMIYYKILNIICNKLAKVL